MAPNRVQSWLARASRREPWRRWLLGSLVGRVLLFGLTVKIGTGVVTALVPATGTVLDGVDALGGLALVFVGGYAAVKAVVWGRRRLLWRVRRRLILSYIFVGFVPVVLIIGFFLLAGLLWSLNLGSFLVQGEVRALEQRARLLAEAIVAEAEQPQPPEGLRPRLTGRLASMARELPFTSLAIVPVQNLACGDGLPGPDRTTKPPLLQVGPWAHGPPPDRLARWIRCDGFAGLLIYRLGPTSAAEHRLVVRAAAVPSTPNPLWAAIVDIPITAEVEQRLYTDTSVRLGAISPPARGSGALDFPVPEGQSLGPRAAVLDEESISFGGAWVTQLKVYDWPTGGSGNANVSTQPNLAEMNARINTASPDIGQFILLALALLGVLFLTMQLVALVIGFALARQITGAVHDLFTGTQHLRNRDFNYHIPVRASDQLGELAESFNIMTSEVTKLLRENAARARMEQEMLAAREIQQRLLPSGSLRVPGLTITAFCEPAREVAGDYFDYLTISPTRLGVLIADVSGKGLPAGLYMAQLKVLAQSLARTHPAPLDFLKAINRVVADNIDAKSFITMSYAVVDLETRTMSFARAGHCPLIRVPGNQAPGLRRSEMITPDGLVLGLKIDNGEMFESMLQEVTIPLGDEDLIVFFTDGISETMNLAFECYGEQRLAHVLEQYAHLPFEQLRSFIFADLRGFAGDAEQHDDMTMILLRVNTGEMAPAVEKTAQAAAIE